jgi:guanine deaminase
MCLGAIYWARLEKVYFACSRHDAAEANFDDSFIYDEIALAPSERRIVMLHVNLPNARLPFTVWAQNANKLPY